MLTAKSCNKKKREKQEKQDLLNMIPIRFSFFYGVVETPFDYGEGLEDDS